LQTADLSFEQIVRDHQTMVFSTLMRLTGSREHIDDLAQEVFLRLYRALPAFRGEALLSTYLYRIVANVAQDEWKRRRRDDRPLVSFSDEEADWKIASRIPAPTLSSSLPRGSFSILWSNSYNNSARWKELFSCSTIRRSAVTSRSRIRSNCRLALSEPTCIEGGRSFAKASSDSRQLKGERHGKARSECAVA
jgi:RNA polymerase sigma factor (sigma-70 family)